MGQHEHFTKVMEHAGAVVPLAKLDGRHGHQRSHVATEALRRRVVEMIRDVRNGEPRVFKEASRANEAGRREILLWCRELCAKKATHQRAWQHVEATRKTANGGDAGRREE